MPTPPYTVTITVDAIIDALKAFVLPFVNDAEIVRGQGNRVPLPPGQCVVLTELISEDLETPSSKSSTADQTRTITGPKQFDIQIDFYGPASGDWCGAVKTVFRSPYAPAQFPDNIKPLYCSNGIQGPLVTGEEQYENRWTLTASLQYNPSITVGQQSATSLKVNIFEDIP